MCATLQNNQFVFAGVLLVRILKKRKPCSEYILYLKEVKMKTLCAHPWSRNIVTTTETLLDPVYEFHSSVDIPSSKLVKYCVAFVV